MFHVVATLTNGEPVWFLSTPEHEWATAFARDLSDDSTVASVNVNKGILVDMRPASEVI